ncbi:MAG: ergothioneine biosynthesis protein EgtB [Candidatus Thiodiazotropha taylori]|nr:ergothioneine biosynthesis protein EgtB [Candidatus Thiodiazotropha taylori]MCW4328488.1 ergothioneine biosynthesis protein EgtB [Candidatus Thiodiazotropha taylori]
MQIAVDKEIPAPEKLINRFHEVRRYTETLCRPLQTDDYQIQSIVQTSPPKWHIAHVTWFFEAFVLPHFDPAYKPFSPVMDFLFNSYYYTHGQMHPRPNRGLLSRPTVAEIYDYRAYVDEQMVQLIQNIDDSRCEELAFRVTLGLNHEQQHQELLLMDVKHNFSVNPIKPAYRDDLKIPQGQSRPVRWLEQTGGIHEIGFAGEGFAYDNETPRHQVLLRDYLLADRFVTNGEYLEFIRDGGYDNVALWLSDGWALIKNENWTHPLYWLQGEDGWQQFTLAGLRELNEHEPVCHLSYYEADAYARWAGKRLPLEAELELALSLKPVTGNFTDSDFLHPVPASEQGQWFGDLWAWTSSPYTAYPGFKPLEGSMGEYNGKFMSNQMVLRGGSAATPSGHTRATYRNFFYPNERWAFTGLRLAEDV